MKKGILLLLILSISALFIVNGCSKYIGQRLNAPKVLSDAEVADLKANYNFEPVGEVQTYTDNQGRDVSTQQFRFIPKMVGGTIMGGSVSCTRSGCSETVCRSGCQPFESGCSSCHCDATSMCSGTCSCTETFTKAF